RNVKAWNGLSQACKEIGERHCELDALTELSFREPKNKENFRRLGDLYWGAKKRDEARKAYLTVVRLDSSDTEAQRALGKIAFQEKDYGEAERRFSKVTETKKDDAEAFRSLGLSSFALQKYPRAVIALDRAMELNKKDPEVAYALAQALEKN